MTHLRGGRMLERVVILSVLVIALAVFSKIPVWLKLDPSGTEIWYLVGWIGVPLWAGLVSLRAAAKSSGSGCWAWRYFGLSCFLWMTGTIIWASYGWAGAALLFPSLADAVYILTCFTAMTGMFHYSLADSPGSRIQATNFALALSAVTIVGLILYFPLLKNSGIDWVSGIVVFAYPALLSSTFVFGFVCCYLYVPAHRMIPFIVIMGAVGSQVVANLLYGFDILNNSYSAGTRYDVLWVAGFAFLGWAALEHDRSGDIVQGGASRRAKPLVRSGQALIPALSVAAIMSAGVAARWHHLGPSVLLLLPLVFGFAACLAIREHALFTQERSQRVQAEKSARLLAASERRLTGILTSTD